jgi:chromosome segregation ATPase
VEELRHRIARKKKTEETLGKQLKSCERNMQELTDSIKRPNLRIMSIEEEEVQAKGIHNIFNKIIAENFPNLKKILPIQVHHKQLQQCNRIQNQLIKTSSLSIH